MPNVQQLPVIYRQHSAPLLANGTLTLAVGVALALQLYQQVRVAGIDPGDAEADMLLFQYGTYNWGDERGEYFGLDVTRQLTIEEDMEPVLYQLRYEFQFDPAPFIGCLSYNSWSVSGDTLVSWIAAQRVTSGYQLACRTPFRALQITLDEI